MKQPKLVKILKRHHCGCFDMLSEDGKTYMVQMAINIEEAWQKAKAKGEDK